MSAFVWSDARIERLKVLHREGWSGAQISRDIGVSRSAVCGKIHRLGLPKRREPSQTNRPVRPARLRGVGSRRKTVAIIVPLPPKVLAADASQPSATAFLPLPGSDPVPLISARGCRWPIDGGGMDYLCCGMRRDPGHKSYCATHRKMAGQKGGRTAQDAVKDDARRFGRFQFGGRP